MNQEHLDLLKQGVDAWNAWRWEHLSICPDLRGIDLSGVALIDAYLLNIDLSGADLSSAVLNSLQLSGANLSGADLTGTDLIGADLSGADLTGAILTDADLSGANLSGTDLTGADLSWASFNDTCLLYTVFAENDLSTVKGLAQIKHEGPSHIPLHTMKLPQDGSALHFLRGVGIPDEWIDFYRSTVMNPIQYHSCFISYSSPDETLARRLHADLQDEGVRCWFAPHDLRPGQLIRKGIDEAIHMQDKLLLILSEGSVKSGWVGYEVETALGREIRQQREILFPIRIDDAVFESTTNWAASLVNQRHIGDFRQWATPSHYQKVFQRLLRDLKAKA